MRHDLEILTEPWDVKLLLALTGVVTALPLLSYARAARELPLSTLGLLQYLSPSIQFLLAIFWFQEPFGAAELFAFLLIWTGLALYVKT